MTDLHTLATNIAFNGQPDSWTPISLATLPALPPVQPTLANLGLIYPGKRHVFSGPQESAKTLAAYIAGIEVADNNDHVILIDFEMGAYDARNRLHELGATTQHLDRIAYIEPETPAEIGTVQRLLTLEPALVIVDALAGAYDLHGFKDNDRNDAERFARLYIRDFWRHGVATIVIDHVVKDKETRGKYTIGSERKTGGADVHLGFDTIHPISRGTRGLYKITTHKDRPGWLKRGTLAELNLSSDPDTHRITWELRPAEPTPSDQPWMPTKVMEKVSIDLENRAEPPSRQQVYESIGGREAVARKAIEQLIRLEYVAEQPGAHGAKLLKSIQAFRVATWEEQPPPTSAHVRPAEDRLPPPTSATLRGRGGGVGDLDEDDLRPDQLTYYDTIAELDHDPDHPFT